MALRCLALRCVARLFSRSHMVALRMSWFSSTAILLTIVPAMWDVCSGKVNPGSGLRGERGGTLHVPRRILQGTRGGQSPRFITVMYCTLNHDRGGPAQLTRAKSLYCFDICMFVSIWCLLHHIQSLLYLLHSQGLGLNAITWRAQ